MYRSYRAIYRTKWKLYGKFHKSPIDVGTLLNYETKTCFSDSSKDKQLILGFSRKPADTFYNINILLTKKNYYVSTLFVSISGLFFFYTCSENEVYSCIFIY